MKRIFTVVLFPLLISILLNACFIKEITDKDNSNEISNNETDSAREREESSIETSKETEAETKQESSFNNSYSNVTGTYIGQIDNSSIEIDIDKDLAIEGNDSPWAFRFNEKVWEYFNPESKDYKDFKDGSWVIFDFYTNEHGQNILTRFEIIDK